MKRREFLRRFVTTAGAAATFVHGSPLLTGLRNAYAARGKTLVVIFQRGGCDGLNTVVPYADPSYAGLRPTIAIAPPDPGNPQAALDLDGFFGLHPGLAPLHSIFLDNNLAVLPTVHYADASRSHFDSQQYIESAASAKDLDGWLNRHLVTQPYSAPLRAAGFGNELPQSLRGDVIVSTFNDLANFSLGVPTTEEDELLARLEEAYSQDPDPTKPYHGLVHAFGQTLVNDLEVVSDIDPGSYVPANGADYPNTTYGRQLKQIAQLLKQGVGLELATVSVGGWDTHGNQGGGESDGNHYRKHRHFAEGIAALYQDLGSVLMDDVVILTMTEFGRTAKENASGGTDHGNASSWFLVGNRVRGGVHFGPDRVWPGLTTDNLYRGRYLAHTLDYRDIFGEILSTHLGNNALDELLPGHGYQAAGIF